MNVIILSNESINNKNNNNNNNNACYVFILIYIYLLNVVNGEFIFQFIDEYGVKDLTARVKIKARIKNEHYEKMANFFMDTDIDVRDLQRILNVVVNGPFRSNDVKPNIEHVRKEIFGNDDNNNNNNNNNIHEIFDLVSAEKIVSNDGLTPIDESIKNHHQNYDEKLLKIFNDVVYNLRLLFNNLLKLGTFYDDQKTIMKCRKWFDSMEKLVKNIKECFKRSRNARPEDKIIGRYFDTDNDDDGTVFENFYTATGDRKIEAKNLNENRFHDDDEDDNANVDVVANYSKNSIEKNNFRGNRGMKISKNCKNLKSSPKLSVPKRFKFDEIGKNETTSGNNFRRDMQMNDDHDFRKNQSFHRVVTPGKLSLDKIFTIGRMHRNDSEFLENDELHSDFVEDRNRTVMSNGELNDAEGRQNENDDDDVVGENNDYKIINDDDALRSSNFTVKFWKNYDY